MKKGDIILIPFPFTDFSGIKNRPALILIVNELDITVSFITTQLKWREKLDVLIEPTSINGIKKTSIVKLSKITTIDKDLIIGKLGKLSDKETNLIDKSLMRLFDINV